MDSQMVEDNSNKINDNQQQNRSISSCGKKQSKKTIQKQKKLTIAQAYFKGVKQDPYDPISNPLGYIIFGLSVNRRLMPKPLQYLPKFLTIKDLNYGNFGANDNFNEFVSNLSSNIYSQKQTKSALNLSCLLDILLGKFKTISTQGQYNFIDLQPILSYSGAKVVKETQSFCHLIFISNSDQKIQAIQKAHIVKKPTILVLKDRKDIQRVQNENVFVCYQVQLNQNISFASVHCSNPNKLQQILDLFNLHSVSTLTQAAAVANTQPDQQQILDGAQKRLKSDVIELIKSVDGIQVKEDNLLFFNGATSILAFVAKVFFGDGDTISVDTPVYQGIQNDFKFKVSLKYQAESIFKSTLLKRVSRAKQDGSKGYVIINANNPTGYVYSEKQIREVCEWAANNLDFILIFDEMYINLIHEGNKSCSSAQYARNLPNIQTIRGFAKQFGLCGFKVAYLISSNEKAINCYNEWKHMLIPHPYVLNTVSIMMSKSQNGRQIIEAGLSMAQEAIKSACLELDKYKIKYRKPKGGVFIFIDLRDYLHQNINLNEYLVFKKLFYEYKVNLCCGSDYKCSQPGWYRLCPVIEQQYVLVGIRRIHLMLNDEPLS